jgi:competence protein ComEA
VILAYGVSSRQRAAYGTRLAITGVHRARDIERVDPGGTSMTMTMRFDSWRRTVAACVLTSAVAFGGTAVAGSDPGTRLDINQASVAELTELPGIGPAKAAAIVAERQHRPFTSIEDLTRVSGVGERTLEQLRDRISVGDASEASGKVER